MDGEEIKGRAKGGVARAKSLSDERKAEIARKAAETRWKLSPPKAKYTGVLKIADVEIPCGVYEDNGVIHRVIVQREVVGLITGNKKGGLDRYLAAKNLQDYVPEKFKAKTLDQAVTVVDLNGKKAHCYEGEDIVDICKMYLDARKAERDIGKKVLLPSQEHLAEKAEIIITSLAKVGIAGLIDEATGYQYVREKDALQSYLEKIIRKELAAWVQRFPIDFFQQIYRLRKWTWTGSNRHPSVVGKYITDLVYARLGPEILAELERMNPKLETGRRKAKHHQWLTDDVGHPMLAQHLYFLINAMKGFDTWDAFKQFVDRAYPRKDIPQLSLFV